jgi:hypothetical protein
MRKSNDQQINEVFNDLLKAYKLEGRMAEAKVINGWPVIMGPSVANRTSEIKFYDGKLFVTLTSASLREELFMAKEKIISSLNKEAGSDVVKDVIFK